MIRKMAGSAKGKKRGSLKVRANAVTSTHRAVDDGREVLSFCPFKCAAQYAQPANTGAEQNRASLDSPF